MEAVKEKKNLDIRVLPMSKMEFETVEEVLKFLMYDLPERGGNYYFRRRSIVFKEELFIAFQYNNRIVASAIMNGQSSKGKIENGVEYNGYYQFDVDSFVKCNNPVTAEDVRKVMPGFKGFNQSTQYLAKECIALIR